MFNKILIFFNAVVLYKIIRYLSIESPVIQSCLPADDINQ